MLITSRDTGRWIVPKGWPMKGKTDHEAAAQEAFEEAGVEGEISRDPAGRFTYEKRVDRSREIIRVTVYPLEVATKHKVWPEKAERHRRWMTPAEATLLVDEPGLRAILRQLNASTDRGSAEAPLALRRRPATFASRRHRYNVAPTRRPFRKDRSALPSEREYERKFGIDPRYAERLASHTAMPALEETHRLAATYFDPEDGALCKRDVSLRVRRSGDMVTQTVKRQGSSSIDREEWELEDADTAPDPTG